MIQEILVYFVIAIFIGISQVSFWWIHSLQGLGVAPFWTYAWCWDWGMMPRIACPLPMFFLWAGLLPQYGNPETRRTQKLEDQW